MSAWNNLTSMISNFQLPSIQLPSIQLPSFASGGVVPGPIGVPTLAMVHGGERIIPTSGGRGGGGGDIHVHFHAPVYGMYDFEDKVVSAVRERARVGGFRGVL